MSPTTRGSRPVSRTAAQAAALLTWAGVALWRGRLTPTRALAFAPVLATAYALILGSYNFFLLVCLVPAVAYAGGLALRGARWARFGGWLAAKTVPLTNARRDFWRGVTSRRLDHP